MKKHLCIKSGDLTKEQIICAAKTSLSSKIIGVDSELFARLAVDGMMMVKMLDNNQKPK